MALRITELALRLTDWCQDKWTSSSGNLQRKRLKYKAITLIYIDPVLRFLDRGDKYTCMPRNSLLVAGGEGGVCAHCVD